LELIQHPKHEELPTEIYNKQNKSHLVGQLLNSSRLSYSQSWGTTEQ